jgi:hypothetical protein
MTASISCARISVAMATYNGEQYIQEQLDSIACQDLLPLELVVTDDGSSDATLKIVETFARSAPFEVRVFQNETRLGYADNFLKAASLCRGDLIAFCDQDDIWMERKLSGCAKFFRDRGTMLVAHSARVLLDSGLHGNRCPEYRVTRLWEPGSIDPFAFALGFATIFSRELLELTECRSRPERLLGHDQWLWFLAASSGKIATVADDLALYRQHGNNLFGVSSARVADRAKGIIQTTDYNALAKVERECSGILLNVAQHAPAFASRLRESAEMLNLRARYHRSRHRIYSRESGFMQRATAFSSILLVGGYLPDRSRTRLGPRAGAKDLILGISGVR